MAEKPLLRILLIGLCLIPSLADAGTIKITDSNSAKVLVLGKGLACFSEGRLLGTLKNKGEVFRIFKPGAKIKQLKTRLAFLRSKKSRRLLAARIKAIKAAVRACAAWQPFSSSTSQGSQSSQSCAAWQPSSASFSTSRTSQSSTGNSSATSGILVTFISQHGITWTFDREYQAGQFVNGDWWVAPSSPGEAVKLVDITKPHRLTGQDGSMINPIPGTTHAYNSELLDGYEQSLDVSLKLPNLLLRPNDSLISTITWKGGELGAPAVNYGAALPAIRTAAVLTVLDVPPAGNGSGFFRPSYSASKKTLRSIHTLRANMDLLPNLPLISKASSSLDVLIERNQLMRPWIHHKYSWTGRYIHPSENMENYSRDFANQLNEGFAALLLNYPREDKERLAMRLAQIGIDLSGILERASDEGTFGWSIFGGGAGQGNGAKLPILFAGVMLNDSAMVQSVSAHGPAPFAEDCQTFYVTPADLARHPNFFPPAGTVFWGTEHCFRPERDTADRGYQDCCTANVWSGEVLFSRLVRNREGTPLMDLWNWPAFFDYQDWYMNNRTPGTWQRSWSRFIEEMWDTYRGS